VYVFAHLLHPFFRGTVLRNYDGIWSNWIDEFIKQNEVAPDDDVEVNVAVNEADEEEGEEDDGLGNVSKLTQRRATQAEQEGIRDRRMTPLAVELDKYLALPRLDTHKIDVLAWWKTQQHSFPLLAQCARKYLCIPASSAPSERLFSTSGSLVTAKRNCLSPKNVEMMVYLMENLEKVKIASFDYTLLKEGEDGQAQEEDEIQVIEASTFKK